MPDPEAVVRSGEEAGLRQAGKRLQAWERGLQQRQLEVTAIAAPTGLEAARAAWMVRQLAALGWTAGLDRAGNVIAERTRSRGAGVIAVSAHLDTAFPAGTRVSVARRGTRLLGPGICDNGAGLAALLAIARWLTEQDADSGAPVVLVANVGEEGEGDLKGMRHLFRPAGHWAQRIAWTLVLDGPGMRAITAAALPSLRLRAVFTAPGGHSWSDAGRVSAVHAALRVGAALLAQVRSEPGEMACNVGCLHGGGAVNMIAAEAEMKLDLRARDPRRLHQLELAVRRALAAGVEQENEVSSGGRVSARLESLGSRPGGELPPDAPIVRVVRQVDSMLGIASEMQCASTDANIPIAQGRQAVRLGAGGAGGGIHTLGEWYEPSDRSLALQRLLWILAALTSAQHASQRSRLAS
ncbi:MAG: M20/M25/M40 family metallo-hydrolase [Terriglobales bacterium]